MLRVKVFVCRMLEAFFQSIEETAGDARQLFAVCPKCGQNRYTGKSCVTYLESLNEFMGYIK